MTTLIHKRVEMARAGRNPYVVCHVRSGWVVLGDHQFLRGYSLLLPDPVVTDLNVLSSHDRALFLNDMAALGDALLSVTQAYRINYEILGNADAALHAHVFPRYTNEPEERRRAPVWLYSPEDRASIPFSQDAHGSLAAAIREHLEKEGLARQSAVVAE